MRSTGILNACVLSDCAPPHACLQDAVPEEEQDVNPEDNIEILEGEGAQARGASRVGKGEGGARTLVATAHMPVLWRQASGCTPRPSPPPLGTCELYIPF